MKNFFQIIGIATILLALLIPQFSYGHGKVNDSSITPDKNGSDKEGLVCQTSDLESMDWATAVSRSNNGKANFGGRAGKIEAVRTVHESTKKVPVSAKLSLQSSIQAGANGRNRIPLNRNDPAYTVDGLDISPAIYVYVTFSDGSTIGPHDYQTDYSDNLIIDDTSGDPNDLIRVSWWDKDSNNPSLGKFAAQLTSTGNGVGSAYLKMSLRDAPHITASVLVEVISAKKVPVSAELSLQSGIQAGANGRNRIPLNRNDPAYMVDGLDINPAIYVDVTFSDGSTIGPHDYQTDYSDNLIIDDTSGDPNDLIKVSWWDKDSNNPSLGKYAAQLTSTGNGVGSAYLKISLRDAPHVTASVLVEVVSSAKPALAAPRLNSPADNKIFTHYPRETTLIWGAVTGAVKYIVELDCHYPNNTWYTDTSNEPFRSETTSDTFHNFGWVGAQAGRWRITAVDKNGNEGTVSEWRRFEYTQ